MTALPGVYLVWGIDHQLLRRVSRYVTGPPSPRYLQKRLRSLRVPNADKRQTRGSMYVRFRLPITKITTPWGFSFHPSGWHPYVATLSHWLNHQDTAVTETPLFKLYERFRPRTVQEALLENRPQPVEPLGSLPMDAPGLLSVWSLTQRHVESSVSGPPITRIQQFIGPHPQDLIEEDVARLVRVYTSIRDRGFRPREFDALPIRGYFLVFDGDYRFVSRHGSHRLAVLSCLGYSAVEVSLAWKHPPIVDHADLDWWTVERGGMYSKALAEELFEKMFFETGRNKAKNLGVI